MEALRKLGFTKYQTEIYVALLRAGKSSARALATASGVPPTAVYPNLKSLVENGLVQEFVGELTQYEATRPSVALKAYATKKRDEVCALEKEALSALKNIQSESTVEQKTPVSLSYGQAASHRITRCFFDSAQKSLYVLGWQFRTPKYFYKLLGGMRELRKKGVDVRLITTGDNVKTEAVQQFVKQGIPIRYYPLKNFSVIVKDGAECKITLKKDDMKERVNMHISDTDLAYHQNQYFLSVWKKAKKL